MQTNNFRSTVLVLVLLIAVNILSYFVVSPIVQNSANSHMNEGKFVGAIYILFALAVLIFYLNRIKKGTMKITYLGVVLLVINLAAWGITFFKVVCIPCTESG